MDERGGITDNFSAGGGGGEEWGKWRQELPFALQLGTKGSLTKPADYTAVTAHSTDRQPHCTH